MCVLLCDYMSVVNAVCSWSTLVWRLGSQWKDRITSSCLWVFKAAAKPLLVPRYLHCSVGKKALSFSFWIICQLQVNQIMTI